MPKKLADDIASARKKDQRFLLPQQDVLSIRLTKPQATCIRIRAMEQNTSVAEVLRAFLRAGAAHYGYSLDRIA